MKKPASPKSAKKTGSRSPPNQFTSVVVKGETYSIGSIAYIKEVDDSECLGTIESLQQKPGDFPQVRIRWFYKPSDIFSDPDPCISKRELFDSDHKQIVSAECLSGSARVISFQEFFSCDCIDDDLYFTRATYHATKQKLEPPLETWDRVCKCQAVANPDHIYKKCLGCAGAFHVSCMEGSACPECFSADLVEYDYVLMKYSEDED
jgi:hypothetical protein